LSQIQKEKLVNLMGGSYIWYLLRYSRIGSVITLYVVWLSQTEAKFQFTHWFHGMINKYIV